jgi:hypothetical protein
MGKNRVPSGFSFCTQHRETVDYASNGMLRDLLGLFGFLTLNPLVEGSIPSRPTNLQTIVYDCCCGLVGSVPP